MKTPLSRPHILVLIFNLALAVPFGLAAQAPLASTLLFNDAQHGAVNILVADGPSGMIFSAADDGSIHIFADQGSRLVQRLQVGPYPVVRLAVGPGDQLAAIERLPGNHFRLSVWDFRLALQRFVSILDEQVLFLDFSPQGNFLVCTLARWNSPQFLDLRSGSFRPWLSEGFGMVDFALMSSHEDRIMSYQSTTGTISYHELASGKTLTSIPTKSRLSAFQLVPDSTKTRAVATDGQGVCLIDLVGGNVLDTKACGFTVATLLTDERDPSAVLAIGGSPGNWKTAAFTIDGNTQLLAGASDKSSLRFNALASCRLGGQLFAGDNTGRLLALGANDARQPLNEKRTEAIMAAAITPQGIYASSALGGFKLTIDLLAAAGAGGQLPLARFDQQNVAALPANSRLQNLNDKELLFWDGGRAPRLNRLDLKRDTITKSSGANPAAFQSVRIAGEQICTTDNNGGLRLWNLADFKLLSSFNVQRAVCAIPDGSGHLLVGQGASGPDETSLQAINLKTNETIRLPSTGTLLFQIVNDQRNRLLHALSMSSTGEKPMVTRWQTIPLADLVKRDSPVAPQTILELDGEDIGADLILSDDGSRLYSSLGGLVISFWDGNQRGTLEAANHTPRKLSVYRDWLLALNADGSLSLYATSTGRLVADFWLLASGQILLLDRDQHWLLANRLTGTKNLPTGPQEREDLIKIVGLPMADANPDPGNREASLPLELH